jgi:single-strand DNA-binding protein
MPEYKVPRINRVLITGNLTNDPELRYTPDGQAVLGFQIAANRIYPNKKTGEWQKDTTFVRVTAWRDLAERMGERLHKGSAVFVEGRLQSRSWETPDGQKRSAIDITALTIQDLTKAEVEAKVSESPDTGGKETKEGGDEDLPF